MAGPDPSQSPPAAEESSTASRIGGAVLLIVLIGATSIRPEGNPPFEMLVSTS